eukprot:s2664_g11.t1
MMAKQDDVLWAMIKSLHLVERTAPAVRCLQEIERTAMGHRNELLRASEAALELGVDLPESVNYGALNVIATATQQRREIQAIFGGVAVLPQEVTCARRHPHKATQKRNQDLGTEMYDLSYGENLSIKGFEMDYCIEGATDENTGVCIEGATDENSGRRILLQKANFEKVAKEKGVPTMVADVKRGILKCLQHLRTMDADRRFVNRNRGRWVSENYDIWVWAQADDSDFSIATVRDGCVKTMISELGHKLMSVLEAFWPWDLTGDGWVGLADALEGLWS